MKKDKRFLDELGSFLGNSKHKDEIIAKYDSIIKSEKENGKKIKYILKDLGILDENNKYLDNPPSYILDDMETIKAYLKGIILRKRFSKELSSLKDIKDKIERYMISPLVTLFLLFSTACIFAS